jgi:hypothetical protein
MYFLWDGIPFSTFRLGCMAIYALHGSNICKCTVHNHQNQITRYKYRRMPHIHMQAALVLW